VVARDDNPSIPLTDDATSGDFNIRHPAPPVNHPPRITSTPPANATEGVEYIYNVTAEDPDNDPLTFSLVSPIIGMTIDPGSGRLSWTPASLEGSQTFYIVIAVSDGRGGADGQAFHITVARALPVCTITFPPGGATVSGTINVSGRAVESVRPLQKVEVRIDGGDWKRADRLENWKFALDTRALANGQHTINARAYDGRYYSDNATVTVTVDNAAPKPVRPDDTTIVTNLCPWFILLIILVIIGGVSAIYYKNRKTV